MFLRTRAQMFVVKDCQGRVRSLPNLKLKADALAKKIKADTMEWYWIHRPDMSEESLNRAIEMRVVPA